MGKDLIVGVVDNYDWDKIKYWANSIEKSGFTGNKALIVYNMSDTDTVKKLTDKGFMLISADKYDEEKGFTYSYASHRIMVDRFLHIYNFLSLFGNSDDIDNVIITDVRDVVFQNNPSEWLDNTKYDLILGSENLRYKDEPWGANNMRESFGQYLYEQMENEEIFCAGVIAGKYVTIRDFCLNLWLVCRAMPQQIPGGGGPDQAAMNLLLSMEHISYLTYKTNPTDGWVVHAGTSMPAIEASSGGIGQAYKQNPKMSLPFVSDIEYNVTNDEIYANGKKLTIIHQWDRVPQWKKLIEETYGD
jgi:hypothetical protein